MLRQMKNSGNVREQRMVFRAWSRCSVELRKHVRRAENKTTIEQRKEEGYAIWKTQGKKKYMTRANAYEIAHDVINKYEVETREIWKYLVG